MIAALLAGALPMGAQAAGNLPPGANPCFLDAIPPGYGSFVLLKQANYLQTSNAAAASSNAVASIELHPPSAYAVSNAVVTGPASFKAALTRQPDGASIWFDTGSATELLPRLPAGSWSTTFQLAFTNGESFFGFFPYLIASNVPPVPQIVNLDAAQNVNSKASFTLSWAPWVGASTNDRIALVITDGGDSPAVSAASDCGGQTDLPRGSTSYEIAAGKLAANRTYSGYLTFGASVLAAQDDSSLIVERGFESRTTRFILKTAAAGTGGSPATFVTPTVSGTNLVFTLKGTAGDVQRIESSPDFTAWAKEIEVTIPTAGTIAVTIPLPTDGAPRFYRAVAVGGGGTVTGDPATLSVALAGDHALSLTVAGTAGAVYDVELTTDGTSWTKVGSTTIPAAGTPQVVQVSVPADKDFALVRAVAVAGTPPVVVPKSPTLSVVRLDGNRLRLGLTDGTPRKNYLIQQNGGDLKNWVTTSIVLSTSTNGTASTTVFYGFQPPVGSGPAAGTFFRAFIR